MGPGTALHLQACVRAADCLAPRLRWAINASSLCRSTAFTRMWKLTFNNINNASAGGVAEVVVQKSETLGPK